MTPTRSPRSPRSPALRTAAALLLAFGAAAARGDLLTFAANGDRITGVLDPATERETFRMLVPRGALVTVKAKSLTKKAQIQVRMTGAGIDAQATGSKPALKNAAAADTALVEIVVEAAPGASVAEIPYSLAIGWKPLRKIDQVVFLETNSLIPLGADPGTKVSYQLTAAVGSPAMPSLTRVTGPDGDLTGLGATTGAFTTGSLGEYAFDVSNLAVDAGDVRVRVQAKPRKVKKRKLDLRAAKVQEGVDDVSSTLIGPDGGLVIPAPGQSDITGASVTVPSGAVAFPTAFLIGQAATISPRVETLLLTPVSRAVFFGPEGLDFVGSSAVTISLPYDVGLVGTDTASLVVFRRDADGSVTQITGFTIDAVNGRLSFPSSHFSVYQVFLGRTIDIQRVTASDGVAEDEMALQSQIAGDYAIAGARLRDTAGQDKSGSAYLFHRDMTGAWSEETRLDPPSPADSGAFGARVAIEPDLLVAAVAAPGENGAAFRDGRVHLYRKSGGIWSFEQTLFDPAGTNLHGFGSALAIHGDTLAVACPFRVRGSGDFGAVFVYVFNGSFWGLEQRIDAVDSAHLFGSFGVSLALQNDRLVIGDSFASGGPGATTPNAGAAYVFDRSAGVWSLSRTLTDTNGDTNDEFGAVVAKDADLVAVTSLHATEGGTANRGRVLLYREDTGGLYGLETTFPGTGSATLFGLGIGIANDRVAIGEPHLNSPAARAGALHVYERDTSGTWTRLLYRVIPTALADDQYGTSVTFSGNTIAVGSRSDERGTDAGSLEFLDIGN